MGRTLSFREGMFYSEKNQLTKSRKFASKPPPGWFPGGEQGMDGLVFVGFFQGFTGGFGWFQREVFGSKLMGGM